MQLCYDVSFCDQVKEWGSLNFSLCLCCLIVLRCCGLFIG
ncbi:hypothetical protein vBKpnSKpLi5_26 [Klebsiella phage vB_KpnS_KpLi5]|nr:hypothetical protein vBKpnSKpLi5_26 [Klebsiella phage vB_KpnS_KpLi5]